MAEPPILSWEGLGLQQGGRWLFEDLDLHIGPRDRLALLGRNGIGKTTLFRLIATKNAAAGGEKRRAALARALAQAPNLLLMDEPTNHLDLSAIEWLEGWLSRYKGAFVVISHDRTFLKRLTRATLWLDRGKLRRKEVGFGGYDAWEEQVYAEDARAAEKLDAKLKLEAHWLERGVT